jgi:adenylate cyclase
MPEIFVWPDEVAVSFVGKANLLEVVVGAGVDIAHLCGGRARCSTCRVRIVEGDDSLTERTENETLMAAKLDFPDDIRLACQTEVSGSVRLWRLVLDRVDVEMASQLGKGHYRGPVGREVKEAAVMFADVAGFTTMSESLPPYDVVHILNRFFSRSGVAVESEGGRVDNYMGDGLLAVFGVNNEHDSAFSAVKAGLEILDVAADMNQYVSRIYSHEFRVRVGIAVGEVIFGMMGGETSARETVIGDVVNTASRLESANKTTATSMLVTAKVHSATIGRVVYGRRFDLDLPGKDGHVIGHEVVGLTETPDPSSS